MTFTEFNSVEQMILDASAKLDCKQIIKACLPSSGGEWLSDELRQTCLIRNAQNEVSAVIRFCKLQILESPGNCSDVHSWIDYEDLV